MFECIITKGRNKQVNTQLEQFPPVKFTMIFPNKQQNIPFSIQINLFELAYQMHLSKPMSKVSSSKKTKFRDYLPYIKRITNSAYLNFDISDMNSEDKKQASEIIGEGISRCLISELFVIQENSMEKIKGPGTRPDFEVLTENGKLVLCESKGSFNNVSTKRINDAITQKSFRSGHIRIAAINNIGSLSRLIDPAINDEEVDRFLKLIIKTNHYIQVFKLAGQQELTKYFKLMKKRFQNKNMTDFPDFSEKQNLWFKLKYERQRKKINNKNFIGKVEFIDNNKIMFVGFDEKLLNVDSFESFKDYNDAYIEQANYSTTFISKDGVCFIEANSNKLNELFPNIDVNEIKNYQESTWLSDIDNMNELEFANYLTYIFQEGNIEFKREQKRGDYRVDFIIGYQDKKYILELKLFRPKNQLIYRRDKKSLPIKIRLLSDIEIKHQILITNIDKRLIQIPRGVIVFDRNELKKLLRNKNYFKHFLSNLK